MGGKVRRFDGKRSEGEPHNYFPEDGFYLPKCNSGEPGNERFTAPPEHPR
jgi:hypothetical protein